MITNLAFGLAGAAGALGLAFGFVVFLRTSARVRIRPLSGIIPLLLLTAGLVVLMSGRNLNVPIDFDEPVRGALVVWVQRFVSLVILAGCVDQWASALRRGMRPVRGLESGRIGQSLARLRLDIPWLLLATFLLFWLTTVVLPAWFGVERQLSHEYLYAMLIGSALIASGETDARWTLRLARDSLLAFILIGFLLVPMAMPLTIETSYSQGLIPGLPRLAGIAPHAISLAMMVLVAMICLVAMPLTSRTANRAAWVMLAVALLLAQSKSVWVSAIVCLGLMLAVRIRPAVMHWAANPASRLSIALAVGLLMTLMLVTALALTAGGLASRLIEFLGSSQGQEAMTMTGRDAIWAVALDEWAAHPAFGYGPSLFDIEHREAIDMPFATHGHNQFIDSLGRTGLIGTLGLTLYLLTLTVGSLRYAERSGGVTLALWLFLVLRSVSEVPFQLYSYGPEMIPHLLLLAVIAGCRLSERSRRPAPKPSAPLAAPVSP